MWLSAARCARRCQASPIAWRTCQVVPRRCRNVALALRLETYGRFMCSASQKATETMPTPFSAPIVAENSDPVFQEVFRCDGIEPAAVQMRRRVQLGIFLEVAGTQLSNFLHHSKWEDYVHAMETFHFENSAVLLGVHVFLVWKYHAFLRDALLARHVTRIATATEEAVGDMDPETRAVVIIETGPWARRVHLKHLRSGIRGDEVDEHGAQVPFGQLMEFGVLHVDRKRGEVLDVSSFQNLLQGDLAVGREEVATDIAAAQYAFVSSDKMMPFLADAGVPESSTSGDSVLDKLQKNAWIHKLFQLPGGRMMDFFGNVALAMGVGTVLLWMMPADYVKAWWKQNIF